MTFFSRLAAYYPCDNTHGRSLSEDVVGTNNGTAGVVSAATGKVRQGMFFLASGGQFRSVPNDSALQQLKGVCLWVKFSSVAADQTILSKGSDATDANTSIKLWFDQSADGIAYTVGDGASATTVTTSNQSISSGTWYHVHAWNDGNRIGIAINGTLRGSGTARAPLAETGLLYLGSAFGGGTYLDGVLDEVALFSTAPTLSDGAAHFNGGSGSSLPLDDVLPGTGGKAGHTDPWTSPSFARSDDATLYMAQGKLPVQRFDGVLARAGVEAPDQKVTIKSSGSGSLTGKRYAYLRFLDADGRVSNVSPLSDVHDTFGSAGEITGATNASPIVITSTSHGLTTGETVRITGQQGNTAANGTWRVTVLTTNTYSLDGSVGNGDWTASTPPSMRVTALRGGSAGTNQVQTLSYSNTPTAGSFTLTFKGETTTSLTYDDTAADIQAALEALSTVGASNVLCGGGALPTDVTVTFQNELGTKTNPLLEVDYDGATATLSATETRSGSSGQNAQQTISLLNTPTGGTFTLTFDGQTTGNIAYNASAATVDTALEALSNITSGDLTCTGGSLPGTDIVVDFGGSLAETNVALMTANPANLTGGPAVSIATTTPGVGGTGFVINGASSDGISNLSPSLPSGSTVLDVVYANQGASVFVLYVNGTTYYLKKFGLGVTPRDVSANVAGSSTKTLGTEVTNPRRLEVCDQADGTSLLVMDGTKIAQYDCPAIDVWDIRDYVYSSSASISTETSNPQDFVVDGTNDRIYVLDLDGTCYEYSATDGEIADLTNTGNTFDFTPQDATPEGIEKNDDGTKFFMHGTTTDAIYQYSASTGLDVSTCSYDSVSLSVHASVEAICFYKYPSSGVSGDHLALVRNVDDLEGYTTFTAGTNEVQTVTLTGSPSEGTFTLTFGGVTTGGIAYNATAAAVDTALEAISSIASGDVSCTGGPLPAAVSVEFTGNLGSSNVAQMTASSDGLLASVATTQTGTGPRNELVTLSTDVPPGEGTFTLTFGGQTTATLNWNATASQIKDKLEALSTIGSGNVVCSGGPINTSDVLVEFTGTLSTTDVGAITASSSMNQTRPVLSAAETTAGTTGVNEIQQIAVNSVSGGTFALTYSEVSTDEIQFDTTASEMSQKLEAISTIGNGNVDVTGGPLSVAPFQVEFVGSLGKTNVSLMTAGTASLLSGGWATGASKLTYTAVDTPTSTRITRRQILRSKPGAASVFYIDVDEEDVVSNTFSSTNTDDDLTEAVVIKDADGQDINLNRHGEPPNWKRSVVSFQNRLFYAVDYVEKPFVTVSGDTITGVASDWPSVFDSRTFYGDGESAVADVNPDAQTAALTENTLSASSTPTELTLRTAHPDGQRVYSSHVTATDTFAESVNLGEPFTVSLNERDGEMTGQFTFNGGMYVGFGNSIYRYTFQTNPNQFPSGDGRMQLAASRGLLNNRCVAYVDDVAYILDRQGIYSFEGNEVQPVSEVVKTFFTGRDADVIKWRYADSFHAVFFSQQRTCRFFVVLDGGPYPRHALCHNVDQGYWWIEEYPWPLTSSCTGTIEGKAHVFLGSTGRKVFTLDGVREGVRDSNDTLRGNVTSAGFLTLTASASTFSLSLVGLKCRIIEGTGFGQTREITAVSGTTLTLMTPWNVRPSTDSVYQIAGISWSCRTGKLKYTQSNQRSPRNVQLQWEPNTLDQLFSFSLYEDWATVALTPEVSMSENATDGVRITKGSPRFEVPLTNNRGHASTAKAGMTQAGITGPEYLSVELQGTTNQEPVKIHGIAVGGVS